MKGKISAMIFLLYFTSFLSLNAQWAKTYGGSEDDCAYSIQQTSDGGYIVAGDTFGLGSGDIWILKLNSGGDIEWQRTYGGHLGEEAYSIQQTNDGGYIVGGWYPAFGFNIWALKLSSNGDIEWQHRYGFGKANSIQQTNDGGYIVACEIFYDSDVQEHDIIVFKLSSDGDIEWNKTYGGIKDDYAYSIQQTIDGGYIVAGETPSFGAGSKDIWILKLASDGTVEWQKAYGSSENESARSIQQTIDGGYIVAGAGSGDFLVFKLNSVGTIEWQKTYGGSENESARSIQQTIDGGYIVAGNTNSFGAGEGDIWVLKLASDGDIEWQKTYGGYYWDEAHSTQQTYDGGYIVAGSTYSFGAGERDFLILKLSSHGDIDSSCRLVKESNAEVSDAGIIPADTDIIPEDLDITSEDTDITPQESDAVVYNLCSAQHTLSMYAASGGTTDPQPGTYIYDHAARITIKAYPDDEHFFGEWSGDVSSTDNPLSITMDSDKSIKPNFNVSTIVEEVWETVKKTPCFIATAAYESPLHPYVCILRDFRDKYLMPSKLGRKLVDLYYKYSPFFADLITKHKVLKIAVRIKLFPLVVFSYSMVHFGPIVTAVILALILVLPFFFFRLAKGK